MSSGFNTQVGGGKYRLQFETDNKEQYLLMQEMARKCVDSAKAAAKGKKFPCESCTRTAKPEECGNKNCGAWRE